MYMYFSCLSYILSPISAYARERTLYLYAIKIPLITEAVQEQIAAASATAMNSAVGDSSPPDGLPLDKSKEEFQPLGLQIEHIPVQNGLPGPDINSSAMDTDLNLEDGVKMVGPNVEHQFIPSFVRQSPLHKFEQEEMKLSENLSALRNGSDEELCVSLQLGDNELKRRRSDALTSSDEPNKQKLEL